MMSRDEIQLLLSQTHDLFYDQQNEPTTVYLTFGPEQEDKLNQCAKYMKHHLDNSDNYIEINKLKVLINTR